MGQGHPTQFSHAYLKKFQLYYEFSREINDERWGIVQIYREKAGKNQVMIVSKMLHNNLEYKEFLNELSIQNQYKTEHLTEFLGWSTDNSEDLCGNARKVDIYNEYISQNLRKELTRRMPKREYFEETELWYLLQSCISLGAFWQLRSLYHGDYRPNQILLDENGKVKMVDNGLLGLHRNNYFVTLSSDAKGYLSPQLMKAYQRKESNPDYDVYRSDVYSLGMTLLEAASLREPESNFYDWTNLEIQHKTINRALQDLDSVYSAELVNTIRIMLEEEERIRPDFLGLNAPRTVPVPVIPAPVTYVSVPVQQQPVLIAQPQPVLVSQVAPQQQYLSNPSNYNSGIRYVPQVTPTKEVRSDISDLDKRVQMAIKNSEAAIQRNAYLPELFNDKKD